MCSYSQCVPTAVVSKIMVDVPCMKCVRMDPWSLFCNSKIKAEWNKILVEKGSFYLCSLLSFTVIRNFLLKFSTV